MKQRSFRERGGRVLYACAYTYTCAAEQHLTEHERGPHRLGDLNWLIWVGALMEGDNFVEERIEPVCVNGCDAQRREEPQVFVQLDLGPCDVEMQRVRPSRLDTGW